MVYKKKSWRDKLNNDKDLPRVVQIEGRLSKKWGTGTCVIPSPKEVNQLMKKVPKGKLVTINQIRESLAEKHKATIGCPITTGIFARIAAGAAEEEAKDGQKIITPYWRTLKQGGVINEKYPGGVKAQKELLEKEGHKVKLKGKKYVVEDFKSHLAKI
ncbi:methylated DNA-protein cysteine methyltransferase [[Eubacterium] cellulosolvens]